MAKKQVSSDLLTQVKKALLPIVYNPTMLRIMVVSAIAILGLGGVGTPLYFKVEDLKNDYANEKMKFELMRDSTVIVDTLKAYQELLPEKAEYIEWLGALRDLCKEQNVTASSFSPVMKDAKPDSNGIQRLYIRTSISGDFRHILKFMGTLQNRKERIHINDFSMQNINSVCQANVTLAMLIFVPPSSKKKQPEAEQAAAAKAAAVEKPATAPATPAAKPVVQPVQKPVQKPPQPQPKTAPAAKPAPATVPAAVSKPAAAAPAANRAAPAESPKRTKASSKFDFDEETPAPPPAATVPGAKKASQKSSSSKQSIVDEESE
jgi:hypothetical protein